MIPSVVRMHPVDAEEARPKDGWRGDVKDGRASGGVAQLRRGTDARLALLPVPQRRDEARGGGEGPQRGEARAVGHRLLRHDHGALAAGGLPHLADELLQVLAEAPRVARERVHVQDALLHVVQPAEEHHRVDG
eukprot:CAMPEP_0205856058 /NCGR_PEP_ID=MMETSP1083-20121108/2927_1 /ASSEMBLY_ACC=CAM_ASM_000430 /TAXON_ID=97485 /ORGANISM="Prymnesium parvum, Strain Texoma1" /LENGTH=133 /DNA_ID=CAMNT_0053217457 /DNA_START=183 /DNA_END=581 /DNA_ORIENTATION=+